MVFHQCGLFHVPSDAFHLQIRSYNSPIHLGGRFRKVALKSRFIQKFRITALIEPVALFLKSSLYSKF